MPSEAQIVALEAEASAVFDGGGYAIGFCRDCRRHHSRCTCPKRAASRPAGVARLEADPKLRHDMGAALVELQEAAAAVVNDAKSERPLARRGALASRVRTSRIAALALALAKVERFTDELRRAASLEADG